jgi:hypothetical protein
VFKIAIRVGTAEQMLRQSADILAAFAHPTNWIVRLRGQ